MESWVEIEPRPPAHMSEHVLEQLTTCLILLGFYLMDFEIPQNNTLPIIDLCRKKQSVQWIIFGSLGIEQVI